jgi:hypothetical protein
MTTPKTRKLPEDLNPFHKRYVGLSIPRTIPPGRVLVHNHVRPEGFHARTVPDFQGFRVWFQDPAPRRLRRCRCGWAPHLAHHFLVARTPTSETPR